jgi:hypothetical protein
MMPASERGFFTQQAGIVLPRLSIKPPATVCKHFADQLLQLRKLASQTPFQCHCMHAMASNEPANAALL